MVLCFLSNFLLKHLEHTHTHTQTHTDTDTHRHRHTDTHTHTHTQTHSHTYTLTHSYTLVHLHTHTHSHGHTYAHIHKLGPIITYIATLYYSQLANDMATICHHSTLSSYVHSASSYCIVRIDIMLRSSRTLFRVMLHE